MLCLPRLETKALESRSSDTPNWQRCHLSIPLLHPKQKSITTNIAFKDTTMNTSQGIFHFKNLPSLCDPAKKERERTKGLSEPPERVIRPSTVAMCCEKTQEICKTVIHFVHFKCHLVKLDTSHMIE